MFNSRLLNNFLPALLWPVPYLIFKSWEINFFSAIIFIRLAIVVYCFLIREMPTKRAPTYQIIFAWIATFIPTLMNWQVNNELYGLVGEIIAVSGMVMFIFTCLELGKSFGVSPAKRSPVSSGIYSFIGHPMYWSHVVLEIGILVASPSKWNFAIAGVTWASYLLRAHWEKQLLSSESQLESGKLPLYAQNTSFMGQTH